MIYVMEATMASLIPIDEHTPIFRFIELSLRHQANSLSCKQAASFLFVATKKKEKKKDEDTKK